MENSKWRSNKFRDSIKLRNLKTFQNSKGNEKGHSKIKGKRIKRESFTAQINHSDLDYNPHYLNLGGDDFVIYNFEGDGQWQEEFEKMEETERDIKWIKEKEQMETQEREKLIEIERKEKEKREKEIEKKEQIERELL